MILSPVILFVYNRPLHTRQTLEALLENRLAEQSDLYIFSDGSRENGTDVEKASIAEVRKIIREKQWCKNVVIIEAEKNIGLANSILDGVTKIVNEFGKVIVLEDDLVTSEYFLQFMNDALSVYENKPSVACITGYVYPVQEKLPETFFLKGADCWGWATWKHAWDILERDGKKLLAQIESRSLDYEFDFNGSYPYKQMLVEQVQGKNDSWAIRWYASAFLKDMYCLYPGKSLVRNIGIDGSGIHSGVSAYWEVELGKQKVDVASIDVVEDSRAKKIITHYFERLKQPAPVARKKTLRERLKKFIGKTRKPKKKYGWFGDYSSWKKANSKSSGYDSDIILEKVKSAALKVKRGEAVYERDSVLFDRIEYSEVVLNTVQSIADKNNGTLHVVDFGGSLGSSYFQYKALLKKTRQVRWSVVEQKRFVECGKKYFESDELKFYYTIEEAIAASGAQVLFLSSVIQYFEKPYELIEKCMDYGFDYILVDRTAFIEGKSERITVQVVPEFIYKASYPAWFLNEKKFVNAFSRKYNMLSQFDSQTDPREMQEGAWAYRKGFVFKKLP